MTNNNTQSMYFTDVKSFLKEKISNSKYEITSKLFYFYKQLRNELRMWAVILIAIEVLLHFLNF